MVVRFGAGSLADLPEVLAEVAIERPLLVTTVRGAQAVAGLPAVGTYAGVRPHVPLETVRQAAALARELAADALVALGGGSAVDTCKAVVVELARDGDAEPPRVVAVPTTYAGAEWTAGFGVLLGPGRKSGGRDERALPVAVVYDPVLTVGLPLRDTVGTALNALAHCAEAYYHPATGARAQRDADTGATAIGYALPLVAARPGDLYARTRLLEGAMRAARALGESGLCLAHAMAQAVGARYGVPQGSANAVCLPVALRFNEPVVPAAVARFASALGVPDAPARCAELAALGGFGRLRDLGVPRDDLAGLAAAAVERPGTRANPRPASVDEVAALYAAAW